MDLLLMLASWVLPILGFCLIVALWFGVHYLFIFIAIKAYSLAFGVEVTIDIFWTAVFTFIILLVIRSTFSK